MSSKQDIIYGMGLVILALQVTGISTTRWSVNTKDMDSIKKQSGLNALDAEFGLWKACVKASGDLNKYFPLAKPKGQGEIDVCIHLPPDDDKFFDKFAKNSLEATRAFAILGAVFVFLGLMCMMYMKTWKRCPMAFLLLGGIFSLGANAIWFAEFRKLHLSSGTEITFRPCYSFYVNMIGGLLALMAAAYYYFGN